MDPLEITQLRRVAHNLLSRSLETLIYTTIVVRGAYIHMGPSAAVIALMVLQLALIPYLRFTDTQLAHTVWKFTTSWFLVAPHVSDPARALQQGCWNEMCTVFHVGVFMYAAWDLAMLFKVEQRRDECGRTTLVLISGVDLEFITPLPVPMIPRNWWTVFP
ncbi:hypothetical protein EG327_002069 [Venturia inaequalis]|uniref:Uncharacterized protein n=1 Tax=Venturia inaequalis TaxID=5025 RepID=A0A8H3U3V4_VENIN|nr:hypothetical protein EG327_002069 [Venturia inaequalis]